MQGGAPYSRQADFAFSAVRSPEATALDAVRRRASGSPAARSGLPENPKQAQIWLQPASIRWIPGKACSTAHLEPVGQAASRERRCKKGGSS